MDFKKATLSQKIFLSMIGLISVSLVIVALINIQQIKQDTTEYNIDRLARKDRAVAKSIESSVDYNKDLSQAFSQLLKEVGYIHKLKINIYDLEGNFILSSHDSLLLDKNITTPLGNSIIKECFNSEEKKIKYEKSGYFGTYRILYVPENTTILNSSEPIITNTPFCILDVIYDKSTKNEIVIKTNTQIKKFIKIYVFLVLFASLFAYILLKQVTAPLRSMSKHLSDTNMKSIKPLIWPVQDEIGQLISSYNKLIQELDIRTQQLIKSEKEGAWKKMAKQIAHEVKNPLTPMRLSVQYLKKSFDDGKGAGLYSDEWEDKLKEFSKTMIQQIDTLNRIANAFSDFASLNTQNLESISIIEAVKDVIHIFKNNNVQLVSEINSGDLIKVYVDKTHLTRVLNNLIQNALQSQREGIPIKVVVEIKTKKNHCVILVKDNGTGIPKNIRDKIFEPNFTTKNSGTGLGLAMVKRIIDDFGGRITYLTNLEGTVFEVSIPLQKN